MYGGESRGVRRAHSPDSFDSNFRGGPQPPFRGGHQGGYGGGFHPFNKRHRGENFQSPRTIEERISGLGETGQRNAEIGVLAKEIDMHLMNKTNEEEKVKSITSNICCSIISFPTRVATYATLIGLISVKHYNVSCQIINTLHASYPVYLEAQRWQEALTIMHLLSSLVNCKVIRPSALLSQFEFILENTLEDNVPQARSDYYVYTVLSSLPFVALELASQPEQLEQFESMLKIIENYLTKRTKRHLNVIRVWQSDDSTIQMDYLDSLWVQMKNFRAHNWNETFLHRPYNDKEYKDIMASSLIPISSPTFQIPGHSEKYNYPTPHIVFRIFEDDVSEGPKAIPGSDKIERFCIENHIKNIIDENSSDLKDCFRHLNRMYKNEQLPLKHLLIETILGELFMLPKPRHPEIFYHSLLMELTKMYTISRNPDEIKHNNDIVLNEAVKVLYDNLDTMNITCFSRFVEWFSFHLNNTEFIYPWQTWQDSTTKETTSPKSVFVHDILERCVRLSFHKKIDALVASCLSTLMPPEVAVQYIPTHADNPAAEGLATTVKKLIVEKADGKTICETLNIIVEGVHLDEKFTLKEEKHAEKLLKIDIFTATILTIASRSLTHMSSAIGKYRNVFKALTNIEGGQCQMLKTLHSCLITHPQLEVILVDKLLKAELLSMDEVCHWIFSDSMSEHYTKSYTWELLNNTIAHAKRKVSKLHDEIKKLDQSKLEPVPKVKEEANRATTPTPDETGSNDNGAASTDVDMVKEESETDHADKVVELEKKKAEFNAKIEAGKKELEGLLMLIFRLFAETISEHIRRCEQANKSFVDDTLRWLTGRMQQIYYNNYETTCELCDKIKDIVDTVPLLGQTIINLNL